MPTLLSQMPAEMYLQPDVGDWHDKRRVSCDQDLVMYQVWQHRIGSDADQDEVVYHEQHDACYIHLGTSQNKKILINRVGDQQACSALMGRALDVTSHMCMLCMCWSEGCLVHFVAEGWPKMQAGAFERVTLELHLDLVVLMAHTYIR